MARKGLLERKVEGAISPTQKFGTAALGYVVKVEKIKMPYNILQLQLWVLEMYWLLQKQ
ncbi:hypothetical protein Sinf_1971 (plasmid) [Streptococcus infantarius subsp. infantarius CJ18]|nr:hypothetical protein Sinf_1971 [Streptococcus infantarius subsp. infantarius CJ18]